MITLQLLGTWMMQGIPPVCSACNGGGEVINEQDHCKTCNGKNVVLETKVLDVHVDKGMKNGQSIFLRGEGDHT